MSGIHAQAGITGPVVNLHGGAWQEDRTACCQDCAKVDEWVAALGGFTGTRYVALCGEARETAGPGGMWRYLDMARAIDEGNVVDMAFGQEQAGMVRELVRRLDAAAEARQRRSAEIRLAQDQAAIEECLSRSAEVALAMDDLRADPRVARILDAELNGPGLSPAEVGLELRASMGLATRPPTPYEAGMPPVADLARMIGLRS